MHSVLFAAAVVVVVGYAGADAMEGGSAAGTICVAVGVWGDDGVGPDVVGHIPEGVGQGWGGVVVWLVFERWATIEGSSQW